MKRLLLLRITSLLQKLFRKSDDDFDNPFIVY